MTAAEINALEPKAIFGIESLWLGLMGELFLDVALLFLPGGEYDGTLVVVRLMPLSFVGLLI